MSATIQSAAVDHSVQAVALRLQTWAGGIAAGEARPALRWRLESGRADVRQIGYELQIARAPCFSLDLQSSGFVPASEPVSAPWPASPLRSRERRWARVRAWTEAGVTDWSPSLEVEAALLERGDWIARPVSPKSNMAQISPRPAPLLRKCFDIGEGVARARLYISSLGVHDTWINGVRVGNALLDPGWTSYQERLLYAAYDVTHLLRSGCNVIASAVGDGWWRGNLTWMSRRAVYGDTTALLAQLEIATESGAKVVVCSDESWRGACGHILSADLYDGSTIDLRQEPTGWRSPGFVDAAWESVEELELPAGLELRATPPVRVIERRPIEARLIGPGTYAIDAGQNLAGYLKLVIRGAAGARIEVKHAEVLDAQGRLYTAALRNAKATDVYILADSETVSVEPAFTFHGFRYAEIVCDPAVTIESVEIIALSSDLKQIGAFSCNDDRLNKLFENVRWSQLGNFLALPTDCPQRDERLGWTGDIQVFAPTACANADAQIFLSSWLKDLAIEQRADGNVPSTAPNVIQGHEFEYAGVGWGDAATLVPWALYVAYGDCEVLRASFESMKAWVDYGASRLSSERVWVGDFHLGDWLDPGAPPDQPEKGTTDRDFIASAYLSRSARVLAKAAAAIGRSELVARYADLSDEIARAAWTRWGAHAMTTQAGCALAIAFEIAPNAERQAVATALANLVEHGQGRIATGFLGTPLVLPALTQGGRNDAAYKLLLNEQCPGWLYQVQRGATTMWERWDAILENGHINAGTLAAPGASMTSFNHYAYGAVASWLYESVAGIAPSEDEPGFALIKFAPKPGGGVRWARASIETPYGLASINWRVDEAEALHVDIAVPPGARAHFVAPERWAEAGPECLGSGSHTFVLPELAD